MAFLFFKSIYLYITVRQHLGYAISVFNFTPKVDLNSSEGRRQDIHVCTSTDMNHDVSKNTYIIVVDLK